MFYTLKELEGAEEKGGEASREDSYFLSWEMGIPVDGIGRKLGGRTSASAMAIPKKEERV